MKNFRFSIFDFRLLIFAFCLCAFLSACANLSVKTPTWSLHANTFCKDIQVPKLDVVDGNIHVEGYNSNVDIAAIKAAVNSAVGQAINTGFAVLLGKLK